MSNKEAKSDRERKRDSKKNEYNNGKYSTKHIRIQETIREKKDIIKPKNQTKKLYQKKIDIVF